MSDVYKFADSEEPEVSKSIKDKPSSDDIIEAQVNSDATKYLQNEQPALPKKKKLRNVKQEDRRKKSKVMYAEIDDTVEGELKITTSDNNESVRNEVVRKRRKTLKKKGKVYIDTKEDLKPTDLRTRSAPECYNIEEKSLVLKGHEIKITRDLVHEILGFPKGDLRIHFEKRTSYKKMELNLDNFWNQYKDMMKTKDRSFSTNLKEFILATNEVNDVFKLNFIILLVTTMISSCKGGESNMKFLRSLAPHIDNFVGVDWCSLMMDSLALKHDLSKKSASNQYCGPLTFLTLVYIRWLFQITKSNEDVIQYCSTELLRKVDSEHLRLQNFSEFFEDDHIFFRCRKNEQVDQPIFTSDEVLLLDNKGISGNECGLKNVCESSMSREVRIDFPVNDDYNNFAVAPVTEDEPLLSSYNHENNNWLADSSNENDEGNNEQCLQDTQLLHENHLIDVPLQEDQQIQNNFEISKEKEDSDVETTSITSYGRIEIQQVHSNQIDTSNEEQHVSPNFKQVVSDLKRCIRHFSLHDDILSKDEEVAQYKKELLLLLIGKDTPQIQTSSHEVSDSAISNQFAVDTTDTVANEEGDKEEENLSEESEKLDTVAEDIILVSKDDIVDIEQPSAERVDTANVSVGVEVLTVNDISANEDVLTTQDYSNMEIPTVDSTRNAVEDETEDDVTPSNGGSGNMQLEDGVVDTTDTVAHEEGEKKEENLSEESEKLDSVVKKVAEDILLVSKYVSVDIEKSSVERVDTANVSVKTNVTTNADFQNVNAMDFENEFSNSVSVREEVLTVNDISANETEVFKLRMMKMQTLLESCRMLSLLQMMDLGKCDSVDGNVTMKDDLSAAFENDGFVESLKNEGKADEGLDKEESEKSKVDIEQPMVERMDTINIGTHVTTDADFNVQSHSGHNENVEFSTESTEIDPTNVQNVDAMCVQNIDAMNLQNDFSTSLMVGEELLQNITMKEDLSADSGNDGCLEIQKKEDSDTISCIPDEASEKEINEHLNVNTDIMNVQPTNDSLNINTEIDDKIRTAAEEHELLTQDGLVFQTDVQNEVSAGSTEIDPTNVQNVDAMCVQNIDAMNLQNDFSTSLMVGEELLQNITMKEDLSADSRNGGCLEIQKKEDADTISCIPDEASEKEINEHLNVNTDIMNVQPTNDSLNINTEIDDKIRTAAEEHELLTQDGLVFQTDVQNEVSAGDFQSKFVEFQESTEGQSNDEIFTDDSKKESDKFEVDSELPVTAGLQRDIQTEYTSNIQMETLDVQNAGSLKIKDFEECDSIFEIQEQTNDSSHSLQMDNSNPISQIIPEPNENVFAMNGNVKTIDSAHSLAMEFSDMHIDEVPSVSQNDFSTSVMVAEELLQNVTMKEDLSADSGNGGCLEIQKNEDSDNISCILDEASEKEINEHVNVNTDIMNLQPTNDSSNINTETDDKTRAAAEEHDLPIQDGLVVQTDDQNEVSAGDFQSKFVEFPESPEGQSNDEIFTEDSLKENDKSEVDSEFPVTAGLQRDIQTEDTSNIQMEALDVKNAGCLKIKDFEECDIISEIQEPTNDSSHSLALEVIDMQMDNSNPISKKLPELNDNVFAMNGNVKTIDSPHSLAMESSASGSAEMMCHTSMSACEEVNLDKGILMNDESSNEDVNIEFLEKTSEHEDLSHLNALEKNSEDISKVDTNAYKQREGKKCIHFESPYMNKRVDTKPEYASQVEELFPKIILQNSVEGNSLASENEVEREIIDNFVNILNFEEKLTQQYNKSFRRFFKTQIIVFFPILAYEHFYVIVINIRNGYAVILDNLKSDAPYDGKYKKVFEFVKSLLVDFLARNKFPSTNLFLCEKDADVLNLKWKTRNDKINCGLYAMIHMEHYEFEDEEWEIGILDEEDAQHRIQMDVLRNRYITKILLHEINQHKRKMIHSAENWISKNPDEFEEEGTEAKLRRINEEDCLKYNLSPAEIQEEQKFESFKSKLLLEINKMGDFLKGCKYRRNFGYKKIVGVDCVEVDEYPKSYSVTLDDNSKHKLSSSELKNFGFQEWNEFMFCISHGSLNDKLKKKIMIVVLKLLTMAKMMNQISADEAYQSYIGLTPFKNPMKQWLFVQICKEVLVGDAKMPVGVVFEHLKYYKEPVEGVCFLKDDRKQCFQTYSGVTNLPLLHMVIFYKLCITEQNAPFRERVLRALHFQKNSLSKHPEFYDVWEVASKYAIKDYEKDQSSDTDGNNMKLIYLTDEKEMMDKLTDVNDQSKLVMVAAEALNELSNPQDIIDCPEPISFFPGNIKCIEDDDFEDEDSYESVHTQEDINKMRSGAETLQNLSKDAADSVQNNEDLMDKVNRQRNPTVAMKSPFNIRKVNILCKLNKREKSVLELIKKKNASNLVDKFFGSDLYCNVDRSYFKNLVNKTKHVTSNIIDIWAVVLNEVEKFRSPGSVLRLFFTTQAMSPRREKSGVAIKKIQEEFLKAIKYGCERYLNCNNLSAVNLVFFPVCRQNHFYVYCFNLLNPSFIIIDNLKEDEASEKEINEHVNVNTDIMNVQPTNDSSNINTETDDKTKVAAEEHDFPIKDGLVVQIDDQNEVSACDFQSKFVEFLEYPEGQSNDEIFTEDSKKENDKFEVDSEFPVTAGLQRDIQTEDVFDMNENVKTIDSPHSLAVESSASGSAEMMCHTSMSACEEVNLDKGILMNDESSNEDVNIELLEKTSENEDLSHLNALEKNYEDLIEKNEILLTQDAKDLVLNESQTARCIKGDHY
ncbi:ulp1 protease family, C-terminal catalytic domain-containing protein [Artemisia annua]|uniref:Ulp1 protease family, C-terminal catalytic domain-containing protein n=1 Tax=Artemisia annua TaxID=35608 RepID=A0A2U1P1U0_ARTAN|nr:ulp1 protease family, C-terminal catalytic domain-containing protein [Artemisia annua]